MKKFCLGLALLLSAVMPITAGAAVISDPALLDMDTTMNDLEGILAGFGEILEFDDVDFTGNGIPDGTEIRMVEAALKAAGAGSALNDSFIVNQTALGTHLGSFIGAAAPQFQQVLGMYALIGTGGATRVAEAAPAGLDTYSGALGGICFWMANFDGAVGGAVTTVWSQVSLGGDGLTTDFLNAYESFPGLLGACCGDLDGDGVNNGNEFAAAGGNEATFLAAVASSGTTNDGGLVAGCGGFQWGGNAFYNPANGSVYFVSPDQVTGPGGETRANNFSVGGSSIAGSLADVLDAAENTFILDNISAAIGSDMMIGGSDAASDGVWIWTLSGINFWNGVADGSSPTYANWNTGEPNGSGGAEDHMEFRTDGKWNDLNGTSDERGLYEFNNGGSGYADTTPADGIPDDWAAFTGALMTGDDAYPIIECNPGGGSEGEGEGDGEGEGEGEEPCAYEGTFDGKLAGYLTLLAGLDAGLAAILTAFGMDAANADAADLENLHITVGSSGAVPPGDGLPDEVQLALIEAVLCGGNGNVSDSVTLQHDQNVAQLEADITFLGSLDPGYGLLAAFKEAIAGLVGSSTEWKDGVDGLIFAATSGALPGLPVVGGGGPFTGPGYVILGSGSKAVGEPFSGAGDLDGDGDDNATEYAAVIGAGATTEDAIFAILNDSPFWPGNPALPVGAPLALGALAAAMALAGSGVLRRKK